jgi:hypothetical protein|tara:strand:- start:662 stop:955 length:294 start_codon:yes stop_codon:yes gene_type:complete
MISTLNLYDFRRGFETRERTNFSYDGLEALFNYLEEIEQDCDTSIEYDPIAFCCEYMEWEDFAEFQGQYPDIENKEEIQEQAQFIDIDGESFITNQF